MKTEEGIAVKRFFSRVCALAAVLCLLCTGAIAELGWVDEQLSAFLDVNNETSFSLGIQVNEWQPFGSDTVEMLNETLDAIRVKATLLREDTHMGFHVGGEELFSIDEVERNGRLALTTSLLPNRVLEAGAISPMDLLSGNEMAAVPAFDLNAAIDEMENCYEALTEAIIPYATEKAANYKISGIGYARWVRLAKLTAADSAQLLPQIIRVLGCGMEQPFREQLQTLTCGEGFTIALYFDEENGTPLALYMKGNVYLAPEDKWTLAYQWAFVREDAKEKDTYRYELQQLKAPKHKRIIEGEWQRTGEGEEMQFTRQCKLNIRDDTRNQTITNKDKLQLTHQGDQHRLTGSLVTNTKENVGEESAVVLTITPELTLTSETGSGVLSGVVRLAEAKGKTVYRDLSFVLDEAPAQALDEAAAKGTLFAVDVDPRDPSVAGSSLAQNVEIVWSDDSLNGYLVGNPPIGMTAYPVPETMQTIDLSAADDTQRAALLDEMAQRSAGLLLTALAKLPGEPLRLLMDSMSDVDYAAFLSLLGDL